MSFVSRRRVTQNDGELANASQQIRSARIGDAQSNPDRVVIDRITLLNRVKPRTTELIAAIGKIDAAVDETARSQIMAWVLSEYDDRQGGVLVGLFSKCYLGPPFVDHKLNVLHAILEHYSPADDPGYPYNKARGLAQNGAYSFIEIYSDGAIVPIRTDGTPVDFTPPSE